jgi:hypothetical protein
MLQARALYCKLTMSNKTIARFFVFVILFGVAIGGFSSCSTSRSKSAETALARHYGDPAVTGKIRSRDISESSGIAASRCNPDVLWTHNDSGDDAYIYAINKDGQSLGTWRVPNAQNNDWEDIDASKDTSGKCFIYIGDIGDNKGKRSEHKVYRVAEPEVSDAAVSSSRKEPLITADPEVLRFSYPDYEQDAETMLVHPQSGDIYFVTKRVSGPAGVYRLKPAFGSDGVRKLEKVAEISVPAVPNGLLTGGDISPDAKRVVLCDYAQGYELRLPDNASSFDEIWQQTPEPIDLGKRPSGESVTYSMDGSSIFATSEGKNAPVIEVKQLN